MKQFHVLTILFAFLLLNSTIALAQTMHVILIIQEDAPGSATDQVLLTKEFKDIARLTNMRLALHDYSRTDEAAADKIRSIRVSSDDVLWFYYSGHAGNYGDGWPNYSSSAGNFPMTDVHKAMNNKNPRLAITTYDGCNNGATSVRAPHIAGIRNLATTYALMFKNTSGQIKMCSATDGNYSYGSSETGGFFTSSFLNAIHSYAPETPDDQNNIWQNIMDQSKIMTNSLCTENGRRAQNPKFELDIRTNGLQIVDAPDIITIERDGLYSFTSFEEIVNHFKKAKEHKDLTVSKLRAWNAGKSVKEGENIYLVKPVRHNAF